LDVKHSNTHRLFSAQNLRRMETEAKGGNLNPDDESAVESFQFFLPSPLLEQLPTFDTDLMLGRFALPEIANVGLSDRNGFYWTGDIDGILSGYEIVRM